MECWTCPVDVFEGLGARYDHALGLPGCWLIHSTLWQARLQIGWLVEKMKSSQEVQGAGRR